MGKEVLLKQEEVLMMRRVVLIILASISAYLTVTLVFAHAATVWVLIVGAVLAVWNFFVRGFAWKKVLLLLKVLKPALLAILAKGTAKYFAKGALRRFAAWLHREYDVVRRHVAALKRFAFTRWQALVNIWLALPKIDKGLVIVATLPVAIVPLIYILVTRAIRTFLAYKVGEAVTEKSVDKVVNHPATQKVAHKVRSAAKKLKKKEEI